MLWLAGWVVRRRERVRPGDDGDKTTKRKEWDER
jgi:hypothetical protein